MQTQTVETTPVAHTARRSRRRARSKGVECQNCGLHGLCQVVGLGSESTVLLDAVVNRREEVAKGQKLIGPGEAMDEIIAVRSGAFKTCAQLAGDGEQVMGFVLPGELMGLEVLGGGRYPYAIEALMPSSICRFSLSRFHMLEQRVGEFQQQLIRAMGRQARTAQSVPLMMGSRTAEQRMAQFLISLSSRLTEHGFNGLQFRLPMSRRCIANYLGLAMETVSRILKRFHARGLITIRTREVAAMDLARLNEVAGLTG